MTSATTPKTILLAGVPTANQEALAAGAIKPGMLIARNAAGAFVAHAVIGGTASPRYAMPRGMSGGGIADDYAVDDTVYACVLPDGAQVYAWAHAGGAAIAAGDFLMSAGDGTLELGATTGRKIVAQALEAVDNSGGGAPVRIRVEILSGTV